MSWIKNVKIHFCFHFKCFTSFSIPIEMCSSSSKSGTTKKVTKQKDIKLKKIEKNIFMSFRLHCCVCVLQQKHTANTLNMLEVRKTSQEGVNGNNSLAQMFVCFRDRTKQYFSTLYEIDLLHKTRNSRMPFSSTWTNMTEPKVNSIQLQFRTFSCHFHLTFIIHLFTLKTQFSIFAQGFTKINAFWCSLCCFQRNWVCKVRAKFNRFSIGLFYLIYNGLINF